MSSKNLNGHVDSCSKLQLIKVANFIRNKNFKEIDAIVNNKLIYYFRADLFHDIVEKNKYTITKNFSIKNDLNFILENKGSILLGDIMIKHGLIKCYGRLHNDFKQFKYPRKLNEIHGKMEEKGFYGFTFEKPKQPYFNVKLLAIIIVVFMIAIWFYCY